MMQVGGALGVAIIGSLLSTSYTGRMKAALGPYHVPAAAMHAILGSIGGALEVAQRAGGALGPELAGVARSAFVSGMDLGMLAGGAVALAGCALALITLPGRPARSRKKEGEQT
jgi:hypothetical protein